MTDVAQLRISVESSGIRSSRDDLSRLGRTGERTEQSVRTATGKMQRSFARLKSSVFSLQGAIAGIGAGFAIQQIFREFAAFESRLVEVGKTADIQGKQLQSLGEQIQMVGREVPVSTKRLLELAGAAGQLGVRGERNITKFAETLGKLETATDVAGEEGARSLARLLNITGDGVGQVDRLGSALTALGNNFAATEQEIIQTSTFLGSATQQYGLTSAQVTGLSASLRALGQRAETSGSSVGAAFAEIDTALANGGDRMQTLIDLTGESASQLRTDFKDNATGVLLDFAEALNDLPTAQQSAILDDFNLAGRETRRVIGALASNTDMTRDALETANREFRNNTALNKEAARAADTFESQMQLLGNSISEAATDIARELAPVVIDITNRLRDFIDETSDSGALEDFFENVAKAADKLLDKLEEISRITLALAGASMGGRAGAALGAPFGGPIGSLIGGAGGAIAGGAAGYYSPDMFSAAMGSADAANNGSNVQQLPPIAVTADDPFYERTNPTSIYNLAGNKPSDLLNLSNAGGGGNSDLSGGASGGNTSRESEAQRLIAQLREEKALYGELSNLQQARISLSNGYYGPVTAQQKQVILDLNREKDARDQMAQQKQAELDLQEQLRQKDAERRQAVEQLSQTLMTGEERAYAAYERRLAIIKQNVAEEEKVKELRSANYQRLVEDLDETGDEMSAFARRASENIQDELGDTLSQVLRGNFDGIGDAWKNLLFDMAAEAQAAQLNELLLGKQGDDSGGGLFKMIGGAVLSGVE